MAGETQLTICGNAVDDAELRFTPQGVAVARFRIASTPRTYNKQTSAWEDGESLFLTVNVWRDQAENVAGSIEKGTGLVVVGRLKQRSYETREGEKRTVFELEADEVAVSLRRATAKVTRASRSGGQGQQGSGQRGGQQPGGWGQQGPAGDPWSQPAGQASGGWGGDEPAPF